MNALLLCAGSARRFYSDGATRPKCLLPLDENETVLDRMMRQVKTLGYSVVIGTGCGNQSVVAHLQSKNAVGKTIFNADYATTNSIVTLWQMRDFIDDDTLLINGDVVIEDETLALFGNEKAPQLLVKHLSQFDDDSYRVRFDSAHRVLDMGKELRDAASENCAAFLGVSRVGDASRFLKEIENLLKNGTNQTWPTTAYRAMKDDATVRAIDIGERWFFDIDTPAEHAQARQALSALK